MSESESAQRLQGQPVYILGEDSERTSGRDAQQANIEAGKAIAEAVRTTLGPQGMDKMLVSDNGDVVVTNDGATILDEMDIEHPAAEMLVDVAEEQEAEIGDGTTTAAILTGELLSEAEDFFDQDIHPRTVVDGYREAERVAAEAIDDCVLDDAVDDDLLQRVAASAMTGKSTGTLSAAALADTVVDAVRRVEADGEASRDAIHVETRVGGSASATELVDGVLLDDDPAHAEMPTALNDATVAVVDAALERKETEADVEYTIDSTDQLSAAIGAEAEQLREYAETLVDAGVDVAVVTDDVADETAAHLAAEGVLAFEDVDSADASAVATATGARHVPGVDDLDGDDLGTAGSVRVGSTDGETETRFEGGAGSAAVTLLVRGGTDHSLEEIERTVSDGLDAAVAALRDDGVVPGGGAVELAVADRLRDAAVGIEGRTQLVVEAVADVMEAIPRTLATSAGLDPIDTLVELRAENEEGRAGLVVADGDTAVADPVERGVVDPASVKRASVRSAVEVATMIVRIDDVITAD
jgi:thermosome